MRQLRCALVLLADSPNFSEIFRQVAGYVDRILKGEQPGELPRADEVLE
ncbi:hypothetical protein LJR220_002475 [Bradyrhizobium sp. LjRoot220]